MQMIINSYLRAKVKLIMKLAFFQGQIPSMWLKPMSFPGVPIESKCHPQGTSVGQGVMARDIAFLSRTEGNQLFVYCMSTS